MRDCSYCRTATNDRFWRWSQWVDATLWLVSNSLIWWHQDAGLASAVDRHSRLHCRKVELRKGLNNKILPAGEQVLRRPVEVAAKSGHSRLWQSDPLRTVLTSYSAASRLRLVGCNRRLGGMMYSSTIMSEVLPPLFQDGETATRMQSLR